MFSRLSSFDAMSDEEEEMMHLCSNASVDGFVVNSFQSVQQSNDGECVALRCFACSSFSLGGIDSNELDKNDRIPNGNASCQVPRFKFFSTAISGDADL